MKKLISKALTLAMIVSAFTVPVKADTTNGTVLYQDDLNSASLITVTGGAETNSVFQWYQCNGAELKDSNKGLSTTGNNYTAAWEVPADFDAEQDWTLECTWGKKGGCEFMIYTKADDGSVNYERYLSSAGNSTYTIQIKCENGQIMRKRSVDSSYGNYSGASQKLWAIGLRQTANSDSYIDNIVLKQGDKTWTENFENASATDFQNQALKLSDYFKPSAKFIETGAVGTGDKKIYLPAKGSGTGPWAYLKLPSITNGVYELSVDYVVGKANNDYFYIIHESGSSESYQMNQSDANAGKLTRLKVTIDKDNNKVKTSWIGADGTDKGTEFAITNSTPITCISFRNHNQATQHSWIDNVEFKRISGSEEFNPEVVGETILAQADFEDYTKTKADYGFYSNGSSAYVGGKNGRGASAAITSGDYAYLERYMGYALANANNGVALGDGTYHVRFSYNSYHNSTQTNAIYFANAADNGDAYKETIFPKETLNAYQDQWVDVDIKFELPSRKWTATLTPQTGDVATASGTYYSTSNQIPAIQWWAKPTKNFKETVAPALDNFYVTKELVNTDLADSAFMLIANQQVIGNKNVPVSGVSALVDFGNDAAIAAVSKDNVKLLENGVEIDYNGYAEATMWVVEPGELKYDTTYAISIEKGIPDGNGAIINPRTYVFKTVRETVIPENNILGDVDFEDWTVEMQSENYGGSDTTPGDGFTVWTTAGFVAGPDGTGQAMPMYISSQASRTMQFWPVGKMKNATYYAEFDYKVGEDFTDNTFYMDRGPVEFKDAQPQTIITTDEMKSFGSGWVKVSFKLIHPSNVWSVKVTNELGKTVLEKTGSYPGANQEMTHLGWSFTRGSSATIDKAGAVDNFLMWLEYDNAPEITKDSIKIYEGDVIQPAGRISPDSDKIVVDFGQRIKASEIAAIANNVYIVDNATKEKIVLEKADYTYDSGVVTISLQNAGLAYGKAYTLHINALSNIASMQMDKEYDFNFIVARDAMKIRIAQVSQNDAVVNAPSKLAEGEAKVTVAFNNGTGTDTTLYLIVANYDEDGKLISADYKPVEAAADNQDKTEEITVAVEGHTTTFMIWDGFATMNPMADTLEF